MAACWAFTCCLRRHATWASRLQLRKTAPSTSTQCSYSNCMSSNVTKHLSWKGKLEKDMLDTSKSGACVLSSRDRLHSLAWHCDSVHILGWPAIDEGFSVSSLPKCFPCFPLWWGCAGSLKKTTDGFRPQGCASPCLSHIIMPYRFSIRFLMLFESFYQTFVLSWIMSRNFFHHHLAPTNPAVPFGGPSDVLTTIHNSQQFWRSWGWSCKSGCQQEGWNKLLTRILRTNASQVSKQDWESMNDGQVQYIQKLTLP